MRSEGQTQWPLVRGRCCLLCNVHSDHFESVLVKSISGSLQFLGEQCTIFKVIWSSIAYSRFIGSNVCFCYCCCYVLQKEKAMLFKELDV